MLYGFIFLIVGIVLILLSYVSLKFGSSIKITNNKNEKTKSTIKDEILTLTGIESIEVIRYMLLSVGLFVVGVLFVIFGIALVIGVVTIS